MEKSNLEEILKIIVNIVADVMDYKICSVMLYDEEKQELAIKATQALSDEYRLKPNLKIGQSLSGRAIKEKRPISSIDVLKDPNYKYPEIAKRQGLKSMLAVPMIVKNKAMGVINVYTTTEHIFQEEEIKMLLSVANLAAVAIENAKLEEEALKIKDALETRKLIERAKGILMKLNNMTEEEAYTTMRKKAMDLCKPLKEIAEAILLTTEFNKKNPGGKDDYHIYHQFTIRVKNGLRDKLLKTLNENGVGAKIFYPIPIHKQPFYKKMLPEKYSFPVSEKIAKEVLSLPVHPLLNENDFEVIKAAFQKFEKEFLN